MPGSTRVIPAEARAHFYTQFFQVDDSKKAIWLVDHQAQLIEIAKMNELTPFNMYFPMFFQCKFGNARFDIANSGMLFVASIDHLLKFIEVMKPADLSLFLQICLPACAFFKSQSFQVALRFLRPLFEKMETLDQIFSHAKLFFHWIKTTDDFNELKAVMFMAIVQKLEKYDEAILEAQETALYDDFLAYQQGKKDSISPVLLIRSKSKTAEPSNSGVFAKKHEKSAPDRKHKHRHRHKK